MISFSFRVAGVLLILINTGGGVMAAMLSARL